MHKVISTSRHINEYNDYKSSVFRSPWFAVVGLIIQVSGVLLLIGALFGYGFILSY